METGFFRVGSASVLRRQVLEGYNKNHTKAEKGLRKLGQAVYAFKSFGEEETEELAKQLSLYLIPGVVLTLDGDLGAGKTRFSQGLARAIGVTEIVSSPTFTIVKEYEGTKLPFYHMDVYRISQEEADELGLDEYFYGDGVTLIEWSSLIGDLLPQERLSIYIENLGEQERYFQFTPHGELYRSWCHKMKENGTLQ
jgi:tRNA threonylcarbamoyladenosine biosynthesis protein TsaE